MDRHPGAVDFGLRTPPTSVIHSSRRPCLFTLTALSLSPISCFVLAACGSSTPRQGPGAQVAAPCSNRMGFEASLASDTGGQPNPMAAAQWFATRDRSVFEIPAAGWREVAVDVYGATLRSASVFVHAVQGPDGTWQVDDGYQCR